MLGQYTTFAKSSNPGQAGLSFHFGNLQSQGYKDNDWQRW